MPWCLFPQHVKRAGSSVPAPLTMRRGAKAQHFAKWPAAIIASIVVIALCDAINGASHAEDANISNRRNSERTSFTNDEIRDGFFKIAFDAELQLGKGRDKAKQIRQSLNPQCLSGFGKDRQYRIRHAEVILPVDASDFTFYDCAYEELLQALGPINDDPSVPWTMFNDDVQMGFFDVYDQYLLNILYDPRIRAGMTKEEVGKLLPDVLPAVREWIANTNAVRGANADGSSNAELGARRNSPAGARGDPVALE